MFMYQMYIMHMERVFQFVFFFLFSQFNSIKQTLYKWKQKLNDDGTSKIINKIGKKGESYERWKNATQPDY